MKVTVIYGSERTALSSTYNLTQIVLKELANDDEVTEFFLPKDLPYFCKSCYQCFEGKREKCGAYNHIQKIRDAMNGSQLIIFAVPVFVLSIPAQLKALFDHFACEWMVHRPNEAMFSKQVLVISSATGNGMKQAIKEVKKNMEFWGVAKVYSNGTSIFAVNWNQIKADKKEQMKKDVLKLASKIKRQSNNVKVSLKVKAMFYGCRWMQNRYGFNAVDVAHWEERGWLKKARPWNK